MKLSELHEDEGQLDKDREKDIKSREKIDKQQLKNLSQARKRRDKQDAKLEKSKADD